MTNKSKSSKRNKKAKQQRAKAQKPPKNTLEELAAQITEETIHRDLFADAPVGKERFWLDDDLTT